MAGVLAAAVGVLALSSCGGGGQETEPHEVLFDGAPHELVPHPAGQVARYLLKVRTSDGAHEASLTATVLRDGPAGEFVMEHSRDSDEGVRLRTRLRETESDIRIEAYALEDGAGSFTWLDLERPSIIVQTPVVAGEPIETGYFRLVEVRVTVAGESRTVRAPVRARGRRTAIGWVAASLGGQPISAIRFLVQAETLLTLPVSGLQISLRLAGDELFAPGIGLVGETLDIEASAGGETDSARWVLERQP
jgi:hypothetical protein